MSQLTTTQSALSLSETVQNEIAKIEQVVAECGLASLDSTGDFTHSLKLARGMRLLRQSLTGEVMKDIMELCGSPLGFLADKPNYKDNTKYTEAEVRDVVIEAVLRGATVCGNEFNIISKRAYMTKEFFERKVRDLPGLTDLKIMPGVPAMVGEAGALMPIIASCKFNGEDIVVSRLARKGPDGKITNDERIPIRVNKTMGADAILGKATRKILAQLYRRVTGSTITDGDVSDAGEVAGYLNAHASIDAVTEQLKAQEAADNGKEPAAPPVQADGLAPASEPDETAQAPVTEQGDLFDQTAQPALSESDDDWMNVLQLGLEEATTGARIEQLRKAHVGRTPNLKTLVDKLCNERLVSVAKAKSAKADNPHGAKV